MQVEQVLH